MMPLQLEATSMLRTFLRRLLSAKQPAMLEPNSLAPDFDVLAHNGERVRLADFRGKRVILWFYPKADTPG